MKYYVDFQGFCEIDAESVAEVREKFFDIVSNDENLPGSIFEIDTIELAED